jgi:hypothetical protein
LIVTCGDLREWRRLAKARSQPCLPYTSFDLQRELESVRESVFPDLHLRTDCFYVSYGHLACICKDDEAGTATVYVHQVLNHADTPVEVARVICRHELLHLEIPAREVDGKMTDHSPEFREREAAISPERDMVWSWIWCNFGHYLHRMPKRECIKVLPQWRREWSLPRTPLSELGFSHQAEGTF